MKLVHLGSRLLYLQENLNYDNSLIDWPDSLPTSPQTTIDNDNFINTPNNNRLNSDLKPDLSFT